MDDRNDYRTQQYDDDYRMSQHEQWDDRSYSGNPAMQDQNERARWQRERSHGFARSDASRQLDMANRGRVRIQDDYAGKDDARPSGYGYGASHYGSGQDRGYGRFTSESYGGRDFSNMAGAPYYGYAGGSGVRRAGGSYPSPYDNNASHGYERGRYRADHERGFLERAGDEIASWFGDDEAAQRREMDHRGNGPQGYKRSDERILEDVCDRLTEDPTLDAREITVSVQEGEVTLSGSVPMKRAKRRAEDCADHVSGVAHVQNNLRVQQRSENV